jgi:hypothetical protein
MPTFRGVSSTPYTAAQTSTVVSVPSGSSAANGTKLILELIQAQAGSAPAAPTSVPAGWTLFATGFPNVLNDAGNFFVTTRLYWRDASASEPSTYTFTHASCSSEGCMYAVDGCPPGAPNFTINSVTSPTIAGDTAVANDITVGPNALVTFFVHNWEAYGGSQTVPSGTTPTFTQRLKAANALTYIADGVYAAGGATGNKSQTGTNAGNQLEPWMALLIAFEVPPADMPSQETLALLFGDDESNDDAVHVSGPVGLNHPSLPWSEVPTFDEDVSGGFVLVDSRQQADVLLPIPEDAWDWPAEWLEPAEDDLVLSQPVATFIGSPDVVTADAWDHWHDDLGMQSLPDSRQQADAPTVGSVDIAPETGPMFDGADDDLDELVIDDFGNFEADPTSPDEAWPWFDEELTPQSFPDSRQQADAEAPPAPSEMPRDAGPLFDGSDEDIDELVIDDFGNIEAEEPLRELAWFDDEVLDDWWHALADPISTPVVDVVPPQPAEDAWPWDDDAADDPVDESRPVGADVVQPPLFYEETLYDDEVGEFLLLDDFLNIDAPPAIQPDAWHWDEEPADDDAWWQHLENVLEDAPLLPGPTYAEAWDFNGDDTDDDVWWIDLPQPDPAGLPAPPPDPDDLLKRIEELEKQVAELLARPIGGGFGGGGGDEHYYHFMQRYRDKNRERIDANNQLIMALVAAAVMGGKPPPKDKP